MPQALGGDHDVGLRVGGGAAQVVFEFAVGLLDRVEIGRVGWQESQLGAHGSDPVLGVATLVH